MVNKALSNVIARCVSFACYTDVSPKLLFHIVSGGPLHFVARTFRLDGRRESASKLDESISMAI